jgi:hypothetical protein
VVATEPSQVNLGGTIATGGSAGQDINFGDGDTGVVLTANTTLNAGAAGDITLGGTVDADLAANNRTLTLNSTGTTILGGAVGANQSLLSLTTNVVGTTQINGGTVTTSGTQTYNDGVVLGADTVFSTTNNAILFNSTFNGNTHNLSLAGSIGAGTVTFVGNVTNLGTGTGAALTVGLGVTGVVRFQGTVGGNSGISAPVGTSLRFDDSVTLGDGDTGTSLAGNVQLDGLTWSSYDGITFGAVTLSGGVVSLNSNGGNISLGSVTGTQNLTLDSGTSGTITVSGNVGATPLADFAFNLPFTNVL